MRYGSVYLIVKDFEESVSFYEKILDMRVSAVNGGRFASFQNGGLNLCLMNGYYDAENKEQVITKGEYWEIYDDQAKIADSDNSRKVFINLGVEDLKAEYERIRGLGIARQLTPIRFIQVFSPYWYFTFMGRTETRSRLRADIRNSARKVPECHLAHWDKKSL